MNGWRSVVVDSPMHLSERNNCLVCFSSETKQETVIPLSQLRDIMIVNKKSSVTSGLMTVAAINDIEIIFCDRKYQPAGILLPLDQHTEAAGHIIDQSLWQQERKNAVWDKIVRDKIRMQTMLLSDLGLVVPDGMLQLYNEVHGGDILNCEARAARMYFPILFGSSFVRRSTNDINAALNYGYSIILSAMARITAGYGYTNALGVHHIGRDNSLNLACDLMEPFRPFIDLIVYNEGGGELDPVLRKKLVYVLNSGCCYNRLETTVETAMKTYALDVLKAIFGDTFTIGDMDFER